MIHTDNFIYFFTVCGFFIGLIFTILNFSLPEDIVLHTIGVTLFFYLFIHVVIMNFVDIRRFSHTLFNKKEYEEVSEYFISELDAREKRMDALLLEVEKMNIEHKQDSKNDKKPKADVRKKAA